MFIDKKIISNEAPWNRLMLLEISPFFPFILQINLFAFYLMSPIPTPQISSFMLNVLKSTIFFVFFENFLAEKIEWKKNGNVKIYWYFAHFLCHDTFLCSVQPHIASKVKWMFRYISHKRCVMCGGCNDTYENEKVKNIDFLLISILFRIFCKNFQKNSLGSTVVPLYSNVKIMIIEKWNS